MKPRHWFAFLALASIWSSSFLWIKIAVQEVDPVTLVAFRVLFGLLFTIIVGTLQHIQLPRDFKAWFPLLLLGISNIAIPFFLISWGEQYIDSAIAAILDATVPLFTILIAHFALTDDKMSVPKVAGLLIGFIGVVVLMSKDIGQVSSPVLGQAAVVLACVFYAGSAVYARRFTTDMPSTLRSAGPLLSATGTMWLVEFLGGQPITLPRLPITWIALLWLGILSSGLAFILDFYLIHSIGPTRTMMVNYLLPLGGVILGVTFLGEKMTWQSLAGVALIIPGLLITNWQPKHASKGSTETTDEFL